VQFLIGINIADREAKNKYFFVNPVLVFAVVDRLVETFPFLESNDPN
jgi:hypothetical protein